MAKTHEPDLEAKYPTVADFVRYQGWIEIGDHDGEGWVVRAIDYGGLVFETKKARSLTKAMAALEKGIAKFNAENE